MPIMGYLEPRYLAATRMLTVEGGLGAGIRAVGPVLEGRMSVEEAQLIHWAQGGRCEFGSWDRERVSRDEGDEVWAGRESVFG